jgi:hypothetical protein
MEKIKEIEPSIDLDAIESIAEEKHEKQFPQLSQIRLNKLWVTFLLLLAGVGGVDLIIIVCQSHTYKCCCCH